ncbi:hypothetical protein LOTGIDRAFT_220534 [Lottia gigantea]|uniref:Fanconi anemia core complex-associated protein 24 pseudonuclease domain-containing protein n=1 Tax=Lottia gigantea TaxID=225164 RepID=V4BDF5_LOTGI|nr:hypothetical protein LOTGIDRAFT_220534 [Lottia gigantea]ESO86509.1 hypothetical protein LOTGIDRAFT_220534 [Lottia gigantea]
MSNTKSNQLDTTENSTMAGLIRIPLGHIVVSGRWRNSDLVEVLQSSIPVHFEDNLAVVDFYPSNYTGVIYISEADIVSSTGYKRKLAKLRKANKVRGIVIAEKSPVSEQYILDLQKFANLELGMVLLLVENQTEAAKLLIQMVHVEIKTDINPLMKKPKPCSYDEAVLNTLMCVPKLGEVKAKLILQTYKSLKDVCNAPTESLGNIVGMACARNIKKFFDNT